MTDQDGFHYVPNVATWTPPQGLVVRLSSATDRKRALFGTLKRRLGLPRHFGWNWDALNDALRDLSWLPAGTSQVTLLHDGVPFGAGSTKLRRVYLELLAGLVNEPPGEGPRWTVVFPEEERDAVRRALAR
jgi:hypothetical protein